MEHLGARAARVFVRGVGLLIVTTAIESNAVLRTLQWINGTTHYK